MSCQAVDIEGCGFTSRNGEVKEQADTKWGVERLRMENERHLRRNATVVGDLTSAISEAPVITHRAEVLEDKDSHGWDDEQHDEHHHPYVSTEWLWGREKKSVLRINTGNKQILINLHTHLLRQHVFRRGETNHRCVASLPRVRAWVGEEWWAVSECLHCPDGQVKVYFLSNTRGGELLAYELLDTVSAIAGKCVSARSIRVGYLNQRGLGLGWCRPLDGHTRGWRPGEAFTNGSKPGVPIHSPQSRHFRLDWIQ